MTNQVTMPVVNHVVLDEYCYSNLGDYYYQKLQEWEEYSASYSTASINCSARVMINIMHSKK